MMRTLTTTKRLVLLFLFLGLVQGNVFAQSLFQGRVVGGNDSPLNGVSVQNSTQGAATQTNEQGAFSIRAQVGDMLIFTSVGYQPKSVTVANLSPLQI